MQSFYKTLKKPIEWLFLTVLLASVGLALSFQLDQHVSYSDDTTRILVIEMEEASADAEQLPQLDATRETLFASIPLQFSSNLNPHHLFFSDSASRLAFLYHIRPRSPPIS